MPLPLLFLLLLLPLSAWADDPLPGQALYREHCEVCHGPKGEGGMGMPIGNPAFLDLASREYIRRTIERGRPGRVMPAFKQVLQPDQVEAIVDFIRSWSERPAPKYNYLRIKGDAKRGAALYQINCLPCHGPGGVGGRGTGMSFSNKGDLPVTPAALANAGFQYAAPDSMLYALISNGIGGTPMPSFRRRGLSDQDIRNLVAYVRSLDPGSSTYRADRSADTAIIELESPYPVTETVANIRQVAEGMGLSPIQVYSLDAGFVPGPQEDKDRQIINFCDSGFLKDALEIDPRAGMFLPCRITVYRDALSVKVVAVNPKRLGKLFNNEQLNQASERLYNTFFDILEEATL